MQHSTFSNENKSWYFRLHMSSNKNSARLLTLGANVLLVLARPLPMGAREGSESSARLLRNAAHLIVQPQYVRSMMKPKLYFKVFCDIFMLLCPIAFAVVFANLETTASRPNMIVFTLSPILLLSVALCIVAFSFVFGTIINLLLMSEDLYSSKQDELQRVSSYKASTFTLHFVILVLALLFVSYLFFHDWRSFVAVHLSLLFFVARITYILKLLQLRWEEMAMVELTEEDRAYSL